MQLCSSLRRTARSLGLVTVGVLSTLGALSLSHVGPVQAQSPGVNLAQLVATVNALKSQQATDEQTITSQGSMIADQHTAILTLNGQVAALQYDDKAAQNDLAALKAKTAPLSVSNDPNAGGTNTLLTITGVNVQIVSGSGSTNDNGNLLGLGNLIIGYNEKDPGFTQARSGSHNIVVGTGHNYLSYGGLVAGQNNLISGPYASVTGGQNNVASSGHDSVSGGSGNVASGGSSSISGGQNNKANANYASVSGGDSNTASGIDSAVSGGFGNTASYYYASVTGGHSNTASGNCSTVTGGNDNTAAPAGAADPSLLDDTTVSGGSSLTESKSNGWKAGSDYGGISLEGNFKSE